MRAPQLLTILNKLYKEARNSRIECRVCSLEIYPRGAEQLGAAELIQRLSCSPVAMKNALREKAA